MKKDKVPKLGRVQLRILQTLWQNPDATAREITDALNESTKKNEQLAHSTVQTLLRRCDSWKPKVLSHTKSKGACFAFAPL